MRSNKLSKTVLLSSRNIHPIKTIKLNVQFASNVIVARLVADNGFHFIWTLGQGYGLCPTIKKKKRLRS